MATFELPDLPESRVSPALFVGAASPLWGYFGAMAAGGVAYWWMTRLARPVNLEALFAAADRMAAPVEAALEPVVEMVEAAAEAVETICEAATEALVPDAPVGGEAAPMSPLAATEPEPAPEPPPGALLAPSGLLAYEAPAEPTIPEALPTERDPPPSVLGVRQEPAPVAEAVESTPRLVKIKAKKAASSDEA